MRRTARIAVAATASLVLFTGCASSRGRSAPDWVTGESARYPKDAYLTGVGSGGDRRAAEDQAYTAVSRIFQAEVSQRTREWERYLQTGAGPQATVRRNVEIDQLTAVSTNKVVENVRIAESWRDERSATDWALAVMDRRQASAALRQRIASLDLELEELLKQARDSQRKLGKVRALRQAVDTVLLRDAASTQLRVVSPSGLTPDALTPLAPLRQELQDFLANNFRITLDVSGTDAERVRAAVMEGLTRQGLPISPQPVANADVVIQGVVDFTPLDLGPQTKFVRWTARFQVTDPATGQVIGSVDREGREGHVTASEAEARARRQAQQEVVDDLSGKIAGYIFDK